MKINAKEITDHFEKQTKRIEKSIDKILKENGFVLKYLSLRSVLPPIYPILCCRFQIYYYYNFDEVELIVMQVLFDAADYPFINLKNPLNKITRLFVLRFKEAIKERKNLEPQNKNMSKIISMGLF